MSKKLGALVKEARTKKGLTQAALAEAVDGLTASDVSKIERGEKEPETAVLKKMAKPLGVTQASLVAAASGTSSAAKTTAAKTSSAKKTTSTAKKPAQAAKKPSSSAKTSSSSAELKLTATEKKLVTLYRKADSAKKKSVMNVLEGKSGVGDLLSLAVSGNASSGSSSSGSSSGSGSSSSNAGLNNLIQSIFSSLAGSKSADLTPDTLNTLREVLKESPEKKSLTEFPVEE